MKKIIEDLGGILDSNDPSNKNQFSNLQVSDLYTVYLQFDNDPAVALMHIPFGREFIIRIKEPTDSSIANNEHIEFIDTHSKKTLKIFTNKQKKQ